MAREPGASADPPRVPELSQLRVVWAHRWRVVGFAAAAAVAAFALSTRSPDVFQAEALVQVVPGRQAAGEFVGEQELVHFTNISAELARESHEVLEQARRVAPDASASDLRAGVEVVVDERVQLLRFRARSGDRRRAATLANAYAEGFARHLEATEQLALQGRLGEIQRRAGEIEAELTSRNLQAGDTAALGLTTELQALQERAAELRVRPRDAARMIQPATAPAAPVAPKPGRDAVLAAIAALLAGAAVAVLRSAAKDRYSSTDEVAADTHLALLGELPRAEPDDLALAEAVRGVRTSVEFRLKDRTSPVIVVTSANEGSGKTHVVSRLGLAIAAEGKRVMILDCDLRKPGLHHRLGVPAEPGLGDVLSEHLPTGELLANDVPLSHVATRRGGTLDVVAAGRRMEDTAEALASPGMREVVSIARHTYDVVLLDTSPVLPVADPLVLVRHADAVIFVVDMRRDGRRDVRRALDTLRAIEAPVIGFVLNSSAATARPYAAYGDGTARGELHAREAS